MANTLNETLLLNPDYTEDLDDLEAEYYNAAAEHDKLWREYQELCQEHMKAKF